MKINPILSKELKLNARTVKLPLILMLYNLVLSCVAILYLAGIQNQYESGYAIEYGDLLQIFKILGWIQCILVAFTIAVLTASSVAGEREKQTLDIMLTTAISPFKIVLGKLEAALGLVCILIISSLPILSISFIFGGMDWQYMLYFLLIIIVIGILVGSVGLFFSSMVKKTPVAIVLTFLLGIFIIGGTLGLLPIFDSFWRDFHYDNVNGGYLGTPPDIRWGALLLLMNPGTLIFDFMQKSSGAAGIEEILPSLFHVAYNGRLCTFAEQWWIPASIVVQLGIASLFLLGASWAIDPLRHGKRKKTMKKR